ncbi:MAG: DUF4291 domain-containing protein [Planctomycetes bacterium]|nr:DUF4291 domain-containing protein [Planctomycetota bacterium]
MNSVKETRRLLAHFDDKTITVYQAYRDEIADAAIRDGTFSDGFSLTRMTWIKPSFGWMLYRAGYGRKEGQERILRIRLLRDGFERILASAALSHFDPRFYPTEDAWKQRLRETTNRIQWDPDRNLRLGRLEHRAIQIGVQGADVKSYVNEWIVGIEEVTKLAHQIEGVVRSKGTEFPPVPDELEYPVPRSLRHAIGMT